MENIYLLARSTKEMMSNLRSRCTTIAELYRNGEIAAGNERFVFFLEDVNTLSEAASYINSSFTAISIEELNGKLALLLEQLENDDYLYMADLLQYELEPLLDFWSGTISDG